MFKVKQPAKRKNNKNLQFEFKEMKTNNTTDNWEFKNKNNFGIVGEKSNSKYITFKPWFDLNRDEFDIELNLLSKTNIHSQSIIKQKWNDYYFKMLNSDWKLIRSTLLSNGFKELNSNDIRWTILWSSKPLKGIYQHMTKYQ